jgi:predicted transcriptional regulator
VKVREMLSEGMKQSEIAKKLKLSKGRVSQIAAKLRKEGNPAMQENVVDDDADTV